MKKLILAVAIGVACVGLAASPVLAAYSMSFGSTATVFPRDRATVFVPVSVACESDDGSGTTSVTLTQEQRDSTVVTGSGSITVTCDGAVHDYLVPVVAESGVFTRGPATASGQTTFLETVCISHPEFGEECTTVTMTMIADNQTVMVAYGRP
jgi:hypothetical protein